MHLKPPHFIIVTDRGALRAGWIQNAPAPGPAPGNLHQPAGLRRAPAIRWVEELSFVQPRQHLVERLSDMAGAYSAAASPGGYAAAGASAASGPPRRMGSSPSETHWRLEADRHAVEDLAQAAAAVLAREKPESWSLSAPADLHHALVEALPETCRGRLARVLLKNLVDAPVRDIAGHFLADAPTGETD